MLLRYQNDYKKAVFLDESRFNNKLISNKIRFKSCYQVVDVNNIDVIYEFNSNDKL